MRARRRRRWGRRLVALLALGVLWLVAMNVRWPDRGPAQSVSATPEQIARGRYLAEAADCAACHTAPGSARLRGTSVGRGSGSAQAGAGVGAVAGAAGLHAEARASRAATTRTRTVLRTVRGDAARGVRERCSSGGATWTMRIFPGGRDLERLTPGVRAVSPRWL